MNKIRMLAMAVVSSFLMIASAFAQEDTQFTGPYLGIEVGYSRVNVSGDFDLFTDNGVYYGGSLGYRYQYDNGIVIGAEAFGGDSTNSIIEVVDVGRIFGFEGLVGYAMDKVLIFANVGYSNGKLKIDDLDISETDGALRYGGGIEVRLHNNISGRLKVARAKYVEDGGYLKNTTITAGVVVQF